MRRAVPAILLIMYLGTMIFTSLFNLHLDACIIPVFFSFVTAGLQAIGISNKPSLSYVGAQKLRTAVNVVVAAFMVLTVIIIMRGGATWQETSDSLVDWSNSDDIARMRQGSGTVLTASNIFMMQLLTRRPILLNGGALDQLPYFPESAPMMDRVLNKIYGVDLFSPDCTEKRAGALNSHEGKFLWISRTKEQWQDLSREFGFTDIITYDDWTLDLPLKTGFEPFLVYTVPE